MSERSSSPPGNERTSSSERRRDPDQAPTLQEVAEVDLRLAMDTIPAIVWTALPDGSDDFVNKNWVEYTNLSVDEAKGFGWLRAIHPDDAPQLLARWRAATTTATTYECESRVRRFDGEYRWFLSRAVPLRDKSGKVVKWYGTNVDIEDRKRAEARISQAETDLRLAMDTIPAVVWERGPTALCRLCQPWLA
jgi:PAS domain S-box-containing protein